MTLTYSRVDIYLVTSTARNTANILQCIFKLLIYEYITYQLHIISFYFCTFIVLPHYAIAQMPP